MSSEAEERAQKRKWPRARVFLVPPLILLVAGIVWYLLIHPQERRTRNEAAAAHELKQLTSHESSIRATDGDGNGFADYWTADVAGFYALTDVTGGKLKYVDLEMAKADAAPMREAYKWSPPAEPTPKAGYLYQAMFLDENGNPYREDYDGDGNSYTGVNGYAFCAFPASYGVGGTKTFVVNWNGVVYGKDLGGKPITVWPGSDPREFGWQVAH